MYMHRLDGPPCILGRYRLLGRVMGKGNYARVEEAVHLDVDNAHVAVKMIDTHTVKDPYVLRNLEREARVLQQLKHPNIMAIFEVLRAGSHYCMVTEPVYGGELCAHVNRQPRGHLDEATTLVFAAQLISAVAHMHALRVVHRDLKTKNIMLSKRGDQVKIVDFGLGRTWSRTRPLLTHCGSPGYAAPEIYQRDRPYGPEVDMWSLGVVLYYMAVGRMPFPPCRDKARTAEERRRRLVAMITKGATEHHVKLMGHFSPEFRDLVQGLLTASVARRLTLEQTVAHPWVANRLRTRQLLNITYRLSSQERALVLTKVAILMKSTVQSIEAQWRQNRLGEVAAMCNILAHKQLATYHASWALRPVSPKRATGLVGAASQHGPYAPRGLPGRRASQHQQPGPSTEAEAVVDQPPSSTYEGGEDDREDDDDDGESGASVISLGSEHEREPLPPAPRPLALLHAPQGHDDGDDRAQDDPVEVGSAAESPSEDAEAETDPEGEHDNAAEASEAEAQATVEQAKAAAKAETEARGQDTKLDAFVMGCLLAEADSPEQLQPMPETKVMFYTETILDNIHVAMAPATKLKDACTASVGTATPSTALPIKSALASQTGLAAAARTRKAVSFSIITTTQSADSEVSGMSEEQHKETGVQANLGSLHSGKVSAGQHGNGPEPAQPAQPAQPGASTPEPVTLTADTELQSQGESSTVKMEKPQEPDTSGATSSHEKNIGSDSSGHQVGLGEATEQAHGPLTQDLRFDNKATAIKFLKTVSLSRKASPEPKKNIYEARRWPFRSPRLVYQRMKSQSNLSVSYFLDSQEDLINKIGKPGTSSSPTSSSTPTHSTALPAHKEESGEDEGIGSHVRHEPQTRDNLISKGNTTDKPKEPAESSAGVAQKLTQLPSNQDDHNTKGPLQTVAEMVKTKLGTVKVKKTDNQKKEQVKANQLSKEKRRNPMKYRRFFPNKYRIDLALVMTLERSRKLILPSLHGPWTSPRADK